MCVNTTKYTKNNNADGFNFYARRNSNREFSAPTHSNVPYSNSEYSQLAGTLPAFSSPTTDGFQRRLLIRGLIGEARGYIGRN